MIFYTLHLSICALSIKISVKRHIFLSYAILVKIAHIISYIMLFSFLLVTK